MLLHINAFRVYVVATLNGQRILTRHQSGYVQPFREGLLGRYGFLVEYIATAVVQL